MEFTYHIHHLPTKPLNPAQDPPLSFLAGKYSALRLSALTESPESFSSTFAAESAYTCSRWEQLLSRPKTHLFVAVAYPPSTPSSEFTLDTGIWVGCATLFGPIKKEVYYIPESGCPEPGNDDQERKWHLAAMGILGAYRGQGVAKKLVQKAMEFCSGGGEKVVSGGEDAELKMKARIRAYTHPDNKSSRGLFAKLGWSETGMCTLREAIVCNGEEDSMPAEVRAGGGDAEKWDVRLGITLEWTG